MYIRSGAVRNSQYKMIARDYYQKFEKQMKKPSRFREDSIYALQNGIDSNLCKLTDKTYRVVKEYMKNVGPVDIMVALMEEQHIIGYGIIYQEITPNNEEVYRIDDIIIHDEEELKDLADGEISIRRNAYNIIVRYIDELIKEGVYLDSSRDLDKYQIKFNYVDSDDLVYVLKQYGYSCPDDTDIKNDVLSGNLEMKKDYLVKEENNELRLTRKQDKE